MLSFCYLWSLIRPLGKWSQKKKKKEKKKKDNIEFKKDDLGSGLLINKLIDALILLFLQKSQT